MAKFYKKQSPHIKKLSLMAVSQAVFAIIPVLLLIIYLWYIGDKNFIIGFVFIAAIILAIILYALLARRYRILLSGYRGEHELIKVVKRLRLPSDTVVFTNLPVHFKKSFSELDMLIISKTGILLIEVKNHSGIISGNDYDEYWLQTKRKKGGKRIENRMDNPFRQIKRQREILKSILRTEGYEVWIENVLFFSNPSSVLKLHLHENNYVCKNANELSTFIREFYEKPKSALKNTEYNKIVNLFKNHEV